MGLASYRFTLSEDRISPGGYAEYLTPGANRILFCLHGSAGLGDNEALTVEEAAILPGRGRVDCGHDGALFLRWEITAAENQPEDEGVGFASRILFEKYLVLDENAVWALRLETVEVPPQVRLSPLPAPAAGIQLVLEGNVKLVSAGGGTSGRILEPGQAWFDGDDIIQPVEATGEEPASFLRGSILPATSAGDTAQLPPSGDVYMEGAVAI